MAPPGLEPHSRPEQREERSHGHERRAHLIMACGALRAWGELMMLLLITFESVFTGPVRITPEGHGMR